MKMVFQVFDVKAKAYAQPFFASREGLALRMFEEAANDPQTELAKYAADFTLFKTGEWDETTGEIKTLQAFDNLGNALQFKKELRDTIERNEEMKDEYEKTMPRIIQGGE